MEIREERRLNIEIVLGLGAPISTNKDKKNYTSNDWRLVGAMFRWNPRAAANLGATIARTLLL